MQLVRQIDKRRHDGVGQAQRGTPQADGESGKERDAAKPRPEGRDAGGQGMGTEGGEWPAAASVRRARIEDITKELYGEGEAGAARRQRREVLRAELKALLTEEYREKIATAQRHGMRCARLSEC